MTEHRCEEMEHVARLSPVKAVIRIFVLLLFVVAGIVISYWMVCFVILANSLASDTGSAIGDLRTIIGAQVEYHVSHGNYAKSFEELTGTTPPCLDGDWEKPIRGYQFSLQGDGTNFQANADPIPDEGNTGRMHYYTDASGLMRYNKTQPARAEDKPIGE